MTVEGVGSSAAGREDAARRAGSKRPERSFSELTRRLRAGEAGKARDADEAARTPKGPLAAGVADPRTAMLAAALTRDGKRGGKAVPGEAGEAGMEGEGGPERLGAHGRGKAVAGEGRLGAGRGKGEAGEAFAQRLLAAGKEGGPQGARAALSREAAAQAQQAELGKDKLQAALGETERRADALVRHEVRVRHERQDNDRDELRAEVDQQLFAGEVSNQLLMQRVQELAQLQESQPPAPPAQIPQEIIDRVVERARFGMTADGAHEFQIELKREVLEGAQLNVRTRDGQVTIELIADDPRVQAQLEQRAQELQQSLVARGLETQVQVMGRGDAEARGGGGGGGRGGGARDPSRRIGGIAAGGGASGAGGHGAAQPEVERRSATDYTA